MSSKKEEKSQAADKIKAAALTAAKGLSRSQAERAAAAAARNVNAYGQKEEGPSRWQEKKEAKRQMYLMSTEKAVRLGERKDLKSTSGSMGGVASQCQKCFQTGHWTYECKNERVYVSRPSRSQQLKNPKLRQKLMESYDMDNPEIQEGNGGTKDVKAAKKSKRKDRGDEKSEIDSDDGSSSATGSDYSSEDSASSISSSSDSEEDRRRRKKRKQKSGKHRSKKRYSSSSSSSSSSEDFEDESNSDSESDDRPSSRKKSRKHGRRH